MPSSPIGAHVPAAGGLAKSALPYGDLIRAETVQVHVTSPRAWAQHPGNPTQDEAFRAGCADRGWPAFVHAPFLVNVGSPDPGTVSKSVGSIRHALARSYVIGARGVIVHGGSAVGPERYDEALIQLKEHLLPLLDEIPDDGPRLLIEPTAGGGRALAATVHDLAPYFAALDHHPMLGVCLDTCHAFAAGHDLSVPGGLSATLDALVEAVGPGRLGLIHANDSKDPVGSTRDRHETIGAGHIGRAAFGEIFTHSAAAGVPVILETPSEDGVGHASDVRRLRRLRAAALRAAATA